MRVRLALASALVAILALAATVTAVPPTTHTSYSGRWTPVTLPVGSAPPEARAATGAAAPADAVAVLSDPGAAPLPTLGPRQQPAADLGVVLKPTPKPALSFRSTGHSLRGKASWYCNNDGSRGPISACHYRYPDTGGFNAYAAAGPRLRAALGGGDRWRNRVVSVNGVRVKLVDWCQCYQGQSNEKLIDLYLDVFRRTGGTVTIRW
jgi:hypothetical protein